MKLSFQSILLAGALASYTQALPIQDLGQTCTVYFNANANGGEGAWRTYQQGQPVYSQMCMTESLSSPGTYLTCVPEDMSPLDSNGGGWSALPGICRSSECHGYTEVDGIEVGNIPPGEEPGTRRVTICHRTCSENNPWVRITIDWHAFEADDGLCAEDGNDHTRHEVRQDCYQGDQSIDIAAIWGTRGGNDGEDFLIRFHGTREDVATNFTNGATMTDGLNEFANEQEYWKYWERACPSVRENRGANSCCQGADCCGYDPSVPIAPTPTPPTPSPNNEIGPTPGGNGDPHFKTWANEHFEYHGQCDLVLTKDDEFADGLGLDIQIRTKLVRYWSYIRSAAVRIGNDIIELEGSDDLQDQSIRYWYNMQPQSDEAKTLGGFPMSIRRLCSQVTKIEIDLSSKYPGVMITMSTFKEFVKVEVEGATEEAFGNTVGLLGDYKTGKTLARDGETYIHDFIEYGEQWQVTPMEDMLFHSTEEPQFPNRCLEPEDPRGDRRRRLAESNITMEQAESACNQIKDPLDRKDCIYDVLATQDLDMAGAF